MPWQPRDTALTNSCRSKRVSAYSLAEPNASVSRPNLNVDFPHESVSTSIRWPCLHTKPLFGQKLAKESANKSTT
jgi:hypothetical protein